MMPMLKILIIDPNQFFTYGVKKAINQHFHDKGIPVLFMHNELSYSTVDLIILAQDQPTMMIPIGLLSKYTNRSKLIMIMPRQPKLLTKNADSWLFYRHQPCSILLAIIDRILRPTTIQNKARHINPPDESFIEGLSSRQHEVIRYVMKGMSLNEISNILHINEKTVSHHKRAAMRKLKLKGTTDLYHWAIGNTTAPRFEE
ncbi:helix-turn-helix domain-containing protein [Yersinia kristensenii]|uniref:helix-turn-helix domain-containing protein n=1 Tax=Yersinia kristensenii TaxID=28152 RepID=UPI0005EA1D95|nr:LuxR C-terminal-related transcriptional regulator [Yersinia kristensenii]CNE49546.1 response regulator [Yersinia kristensenii]CNG89423.1 response regulator [Yersinia kristensenii]CNK24939.1 response regulator [Yersinia kristensenii]